MLIWSFLQFTLPLKSQVGGTDDQHSLGESAQFEFADQQTSHDGLARASIISEKEADSRQLQQIVIDRFKLVLRLYDTPVTTGSQIAGLAMPEIVAEHCG